jgi:hypothetical protein
MAIAAIGLVLIQAIFRDQLMKWGFAMSDK